MFVYDNLGQYEPCSTNVTISVQVLLEIGLNVLRMKSLLNGVIMASKNENPRPSLLVLNSELLRSD